VLIAATKCVNERCKIFNFEAVYQKYQAFYRQHQMPNLKLNRQVFLKLFVDLINQGLLRSDGGE
jgi:hypothetical protein